MKWWNSKKIRKWLRILHRDLGYFAVGITLVYSVSGIILNHKKHEVDPAFKAISESMVAPKSLSIEGFTEFWEEQNFGIDLNKTILAKGYYRLFLDGGMGDYDPQSGELNFEVYQKRDIVYFINKLHLNQKNHWIGVADFSAIVLLFLALSGLIMIKGKNGFKKRGVWFMVAGFVLVIVYIWI